VFEIPSTGGVDARTAGPAIGNLWTYSDGRSDADDEDGVRAALLVDYSRIWLVVAKILYRFDDQGRLLTTINLAKRSSVRVCTELSSLGRH
jgi:hypothetical protein